MEDQQQGIDEQAIRNHQVTLLELLDRLIDKGVVVKGEILLTVADVDLVYLNLALLLSSVKTVVRAAGEGGTAAKKIPSPKRTPSPAIADQLPPIEQRQRSSPSPQAERVHSERAAQRESALTARTALPVDHSNVQRRAASGINVDPEHVERGLVALVLTLVDLLRQLMEKQAIRRIEDEQLTEEEVERVGNAFYLLDEKMRELKEKFDLSDDDLNLHLGPLGDLL